MRKLKKSEQILLGVLAVVVLFYVWSQFGSGGAKNQAPAQTGTVAKLAKQVEAAAAGLTQLVKREEVKIPQAVRAQFVGWGRDPFLGANRLAPEDSLAPADSIELAWKGILRTDRGTLVMIGPYVLAEGEREGDLELLKVERDYVICRYRGKRLTLFRPGKSQ